MARVALVIGTGEYGDSFKPLPAAPKDVEAICAVLRDEAMGGFEEITPLINPDHSHLRETIETWFRARQKDDLALLYLSGHGIKDDQLDLYFAATNTRKQKEELIRSTAVAASFVRDCIRNSKAKRQIIILDCCFSGAFGDLLTKDDDSIKLDLLGTEDPPGVQGRVVLTSSSSLQYSFEQGDGNLSIYTRYLIEGIRTGAADIDGDGAISVQELHEYASRKVQEESPAMTPKIIVLKDEGYRLRIANAPLDDPEVKYRKEVEAIVQEDGGEIDEICSRPILETLQRKLSLSNETAQRIEDSVLEPIRQFRAKRAKYQEFFIRVIQHKNPLGEREQKRLTQLRQLLGLRPEDIDSIESERLAIMPPVSVSLTETTPKSVTSEPASPFSPPVPDELVSEKGVDYSRLRDFLKAGKWKEADRETDRVMLQVVGRQENDFLRVEDIENFPCADLKTIDRLWVQYSNGRFGFSVQKEIYLQCGGKLDGNYPGNPIWHTFCNLTGWRVKDQYISNADVTYDTSAPPGHLPSSWRYYYLRKILVVNGVVLDLFSRIQTCKV